MSKSYNNEWRAEMYITITKNELTSFKIIDDQHKEMIDLVNALYENLEIKNLKIEKDLLGKLVDHLRLHFDTEEKFMLDTKFPGYISHKLEHDRFYGKIADYFDKLQKGKKSVVDKELLRSIKNWFYNHLDFKDKRCAAFFIEKGVS